MLGGLYLRLIVQVDCRKSTVLVEYVTNEGESTNGVIAYPLMIASVSSKLKSLIAHNALEVSEPNYRPRGDVADDNTRRQSSINKNTKEREISTKFELDECSLNPKPFFVCASDLERGFETKHLFYSTQISAFRTSGAKPQIMENDVCRLMRGHNYA